MKCPKCNHELPEDPIGLTPILKANKDLIALMLADSLSAGKAGVSNATTARALVDLYYTFQDVRKAASNQVRAIEQGADAGDKHEALDFMLRQIETMENNAKAYLNAFVQEHEMHPWFVAVPGVGPVLSAGLVAHLGGRELPPTVGHWWRYAGLDPSQKWLKEDKLRKLWEEQSGDVEMRMRVLSHYVGRDPETVLRDATLNFKTGESSPLTKTKAIKSLARIPYNRPLKTLCWKIGDQFVKLGTREDAFYAKFYRDRKAREIARNEKGERAQMARATLEKTPQHAQRKIYAEGKLPDGRIDLMARRATVKLFLSHLHELWYRMEKGESPPHPFSTTISGHAHYIEPPYKHALGL